MRVLIIIFFLLLSFPGFSQNSAVTDFKEQHGTALSLYFYPSTLRMINLERNPEWDEMIRGIKKARFFQMDSGAVSSDELIAFITLLADKGFEEMLNVRNKKLDMQVWGIEKRLPEMILIFRSGQELYLLEIQGMINVAKVPKLIDSFSESAFLNVLDLKNKKIN